MTQTENYGRYKVIFSILAVAVFIWGVIGALDITNIPSAGYYNSPENVVTFAREGGPAAQAGLNVGDTITRIDGIPIENYTALAIADRPAIGSEGSLSVKRGDGEQTFSFRYGSQPTTDLIAGYGAFTLTGLAFLILGLMAYLKRPTRLSTQFCALSLLFALTLFNPPYFASSVSRRMRDAILAILFAALLALILDYCLNYPRAKKIIAERRWLKQAIYMIAIAWGVMIATITLSTPPMSIRRQMMLFLSSGLIVGGYVLLAIISIIHTYMKSAAEERRAAGLNLMLAGLLIGFGPIILTIIIRLFSPNIAALPGERFATITFIAIPIGMAMALMKLESSPAAIEAEEGATA